MQNASLSHENFNDNIVDYILDDVDSDMAKAMKQHYMECDECWENYMLVMDMFDLLEEEKLSDIMGVEPLTEEELAEENRPLILESDGVETVIQLIEDKITVPLKEGIHILKLAGKILKKIEIEGTPLFGFGDASVEKETVYEDENIAVTLIKQTEDNHLIIKKN